MGHLSSLKPFGVAGATMLASDRRPLGGMAVWKNGMISRLGRRMARPQASRKQKRNAFGWSSRTNGGGIWAGCSVAFVSPLIVHRAAGTCD